MQIAQFGFVELYQEAPDWRGVSGREPAVFFSGRLGEDRWQGREWMRMAEHTPDRLEAPGGSVALALRMTNEAVLAAADVSEPHLRAPLSARISALWKVSDLELAAREAGAALALAEAIDDPYVRSFTLAQVSGDLAAADPPSAATAARAALRAAKTVTDLGSRTVALAEAAKALGASDYARARRVLTEAEHLAGSACSCKRRCLPAAVLERTAALDPEDALRKADRIPDPRARGVILARVIPRLAAVDPQRAVALVEQVPELHEKIEAWSKLCGALVAIHPALAVFAAECAEANARFSHYELVQLKALAQVAWSLHRADSVRAMRLLSAAETVFEQTDPSYSRSLTAGELARAQARFDVERGESTARQIVQPHPRAHAFMLLAEDLRAGAGL